MAPRKKTWGGKRPGAGRPKKNRDIPIAPTAAPPKAPPPSTDGARSAAPPERIEPLEYMLRVMNDPASPADRRDRMAMAAAPYVHGKMGEKGKKEQKNEAARKLASRFAASAPPRPIGSASH